VLSLMPLFKIYKIVSDLKMSCTESNSGAKRKSLTEPDVEIVNEPKKQKRSSDSTLVVCFDLELTDGAISSEIFQLGAATSVSEYSSFILPKGAIDWGVTRFVNGIKVGMGTHGRQLESKEGVIASVDSHEGLSGFIDWITLMKDREQSDQVILISHGEMDVPALMNNLARDGLLDKLKEKVDLFVDSLKYFQANFPNWTTYKLPLMYKNTFPDRNPFKAHDALADAKSLYEILEQANKGKREHMLRQLNDIAVDFSKSCDMAKKRIMKTIQKRGKKKVKTMAFNFSALERGKNEESRGTPVGNKFVTNRSATLPRKYSLEERRRNGFCRSWNSSQTCLYGDACRFSHVG